LFTVTRSTLRKHTPIRRQTHLAVIELPDEISAFQAYRLLHYHGISPEHLAIVGEGYSSPERIGLLLPRQIVQRKATKFAMLAGLVGAVVGGVLLAAAGVYDLTDGMGKTIATVPSVLGLNLTGFVAMLQHYPAALLVPLLAIVGSTLGAIVGALLGLFEEGTAAGLYRHRLRQGRYLLMIEGSEKLVRWGQEVLSQYSTSRLY
jgi:uncharacterized membrane protein YeaQ/YmgE (transglycosylase-associated protein family)